MSEFKFSCPHCSQHITADDTFAGNQIKCPTCQRDIVIPAAVPVAATPAPAAPRLQSPPPPRPSAPPPPRGYPPAPALAYASHMAPPRVSGMAIAALICSLPAFPLMGIGIRSYGTALLSLVAIIPAILLGHSANSQIAGNRQLYGRAFSVAGLTIAYLCAALLAFGYSIREYKKYQFRQEFSQSRAPSPPAAPPEARSSPATRPAPRPVRQDPRVTTNPATASIPNSTVFGKIHGQEFTCESATLQGGRLTLRQGKGFQADREVSLVLWLKAGEGVEGKTWNISPAIRSQSGPAPHIHLRWTEGGSAQNETSLGNYALHLEFARASGNLQGKIYLELSQSLDTKIAGTFQAELK